MFCVFEKCPLFLKEAVGYAFGKPLCHTARLFYRVAREYKLLRIGVYAVFGFIGLKPFLHLRISVGLLLCFASVFIEIFPILALPLCGIRTGFAYCVFALCLFFFVSLNLGLEFFERRLFGGFRCRYVGGCLRYFNCFLFGYNISHF